MSAAFCAATGNAPVAPELRWPGGLAVTVMPSCGAGTPLMLPPETGGPGGLGVMVMPSCGADTPLMLPTVGTAWRPSASVSFTGLFRQ